MKRLSFLLGSLLVLGLALPAAGQGYYAGITGGLNIADMKITGDGADQEVDAATLLGAGAVAGLQLNPNFVLQLRPLYLQKGGRLMQEAPSPNIDFRMSFVEIDLSVKAMTGEAIRPYLVGGPSIGFLTSAELELDSEGNKITADLMDLLEKIEFGLGIGGGVEFDLGQGSLFIEGRYTFALNNLNKGGTIQFEYEGMIVGTEELSPEEELINRGFQIMAGYTLPLGGE